MKTKEVKFETAREFLNANRDYTFKKLCVTFSFKQVDFKTLVNDYFQYIEKSDYTRWFTLRMDVKQVSKVIDNSIQCFFLNSDYNINRVAMDQFQEERRQKAYNEMFGE